MSWLPEMDQFINEEVYEDDLSEYDLNPSDILDYNFLGN